MMRLTRYCFLCCLFIGVLAGCKDTRVSIVNEGPGSDGAAQVARVTGVVRDVSGLPIQGVHVVTIPFGRATSTDDIGRRIIDDVKTDANGNFVIAQVQQSSYKLLFLGSGYIKESLTIGPIDFNPDNLVDNAIQKSVVLEAFPALGDGDTPAVAVFDPEDKKRTTEILASSGIRFVDVRGDVANLNADNFNVLVIGHDATIYHDINELIDHRQVLDAFLAAGGSIYIGQINDFSVESTPMPFLTGEQQFILHTENAPFNDFTTANVQDAGHPLVLGVSFNDWSFIEAGQQTVKQNVTFDAAIVSSFAGPDWHIIVTTPATDFVAGEGTVLADADVVIAEYRDPRSGASIVVNQAAYYQGAFGDLTEVEAIRLTSNVAAYIKQLNSRVIVP